MKKPLTDPRARLAKNLKVLMDVQALGAYDVARAAGVDAKTVYNMLKSSFDPRLSRVEKIARVFGLTTWQLLAHDMALKPPDSKAVVTLLEHYSKAPDAGRKAIMQVAEIASEKTAE